MTVPTRTTLPFTPRTSCRLYTATSADQRYACLISDHFSSSSLLFDLSVTQSKSNKRGSMNMSGVLWSGDAETTTDFENVERGQGRRWAGGPEVWTPSPPRPDQGHLWIASRFDEFFWRGGGERGELNLPLNPPCSTVSAIAELLVSLWHSHFHWSCVFVGLQ